MKTTRQNVFETNSSSSHSLGIAPYGDKDTLKLDEDKNVVISGCYQFGWGPEDIFDIKSKIAYYYICNEFNEDALDLLKEIIREETGANEVLIDVNTDYTKGDYSYVDHQSIDTAKYMSKENLKDFIFNKDSYIHLDNDNWDGDEYPNYGMIYIE